MNEIKNSAGKVIGYTEIKENQIIIHNNSKPELIINNIQDIKRIIDKDKSEDFLIYLYDNYYLSCGEIASLYEVCYSNINKKLKSLSKKTSPKEGRRNRSFGKQQSTKTKEAISNTLIEGHKNGIYEKQIPYERTPEIKEKISKSLKKYFSEHPQNPEPHRKNWEKGIYEKVDFHRGIGGKFFSIKNQQQIYFRSLLELHYMLILEEDKQISHYQYEPIHIKCENNTIYTPDIQYDNIIIELKSYKYIHSKKDILDAFLYKKEQGEKYCLKNGLEYKVIFDKDIDFDSARMKRHLKNHPEIIEKYKITFNNPKRMVIK